MSGNDVPVAIAPGAAEASGPAHRSVGSSDSLDARVVLRAPVGLEVLARFNRAGVLVPADVHVAERLLALAGESATADAPMVALGAALAVRAPRASHVAVDLRSPATAVPGIDDDVDLASLDWPDPESWIAALAASSLVAVDDPAGGARRPLVLEGSVLYLNRYWSDEVSVAAAIRDRLRAHSSPLGPQDDLRLARLFPGEGSAEQLAAARIALSGPFSVIVGGPGTGKTTAVARILAALAERAAEEGHRPLHVALAAPTGKAAARLEEAVRSEAVRLETAGSVRDWLGALRGSTLHRLLGYRFDQPGRFRHHAGQRLPHDIVVVDEASMVSLAMMARLAEAVAPAATIVLVGDPQQLVSVEAGAVLADIVGPAGTADPEATHESPMARSVGVLRRNHRFRGALAELADAIREGDVERAMGAMGAGDSSVSWIALEDADDLSRATTPELLAVKERITSWGSELAAAARAGDAGRAVEILRSERLLCAHRSGPAGVAVLNPTVEAWIHASTPPGPGDGTWYAGRPVMVTTNDYGTGLYNGDTGVAIAQRPGAQDRADTEVDWGAPGDGVGLYTVAFDEGQGQAARLVSNSRLGYVETVYAMTVHKSQGSEFERVSLVLPPAGSRLLTREMLYTAVTRARAEVCVIGQEAALVTAIATPVARASGLGPRLWAPGDAGPVDGRRGPAAG